MAKTEESLQSQSTGKLVPVRGRSLPSSSVRVNPALVQFVQLDDLNLQLGHLIRLMKLQLEQGYIWNYPAFSVASMVEIKVSEGYYPIQLFSLLVSNDGPNDVFCHINDTHHIPSEVKNGEVFRTSFARGVIRTIYLIPTVAGTSATIRLSGTY